MLLGRMMSLGHFSRKHRFGIELLYHDKNDGSKRNDTNMKKTILTMAGILMMGIVVNAQTDSTLVSPDEMVQGKESSAPVQNPTPANPERVRVQATDLPQGLKQTLTGSQYNGWERSPIYMNKTTNQYSLSVPSNGSARTYTFDQTGRPIVGEASGSTLNPAEPISPVPADNSSTYSSRKSSTNSNTRTGGRKTTTTHKSSTVKKNSSSDNSSSSTTKGASTSTPPAK